ncbi:MAG TPA: aminotransferase class V-fold PLP-dependent enzyme [Candidatus Ruthenibacterium merdigallinarum]|nr:aminotransferase class V-fold PLP-dependent enzyme [Candidatus Ruthenibacterium merdigallinarum]
MDHIIYADNAATTPVDARVVEAMTPYFSQCYGNPSSIFYSVGAAAGEALAAARASVAKSLGCEPAEVFFTSCGTEADNWAIKGTAHRLAAKGKKHLITSCIEHHAVLHSMRALEKDGFSVTYLPVDSQGFVRPADVEAAIRPDTALVSIMFANNEIGTVEPVQEIAAVCRRRGVWFHTDAVQAAGALPIHFKDMGFDMLSLSAHKFNGPKGVGALLVRRGVLPDIFMDGGGQERGRRAGTENVAGIVGLAKALELAVASLPQKAEKLAALRDAVQRHVQTMPHVHINGPADPARRLPGLLNVSFEGAESESILLFLDMAGICASSGSACASGSLDPSHVLLSIGLSHAVANCSLRLSFGVQNTPEDAQAICRALTDSVAEVRRRSAIYSE